jgi:tRNA pseudouridine55 synthase
MDMNGLLLLNKPSGWTSHDVVAKARGILREKQIGHLGTLDPLATGVLPLAVGAATRLIEFSSFTKEYAAVCLLGKTTDSCDTSGKILTQSDVSGLSEENIREELLKMKSLTEQIPPMVSAVKSGGKRLYELARQGLVVDRKPRPIQIEEIELLRMEIPRVVFRVVCSAGTYVRVLCQSLGEALGVGGCMESLERTRVGPFQIRQSQTLEQIKLKVETGDFGFLLPPSLLAEHLPKIALDEKNIFDLCQGKKRKMALPDAGYYRVINQAGRLCAIGEALDLTELKPKKVFGVEGIP